MGCIQTELIKTTNGFKEVLQSRSENMKSQHNRRGQYGGVSVAASSLLVPSGNIPFGKSSGATFGDKGPSSVASAGSEGSALFSNPYLRHPHAGAPLLGGRSSASNSSRLDDENDDDCVITVPSMQQLQLVPRPPQQPCLKYAAESTT